MTKGEQSKRKIVETAGELFWKNGYTKTGISEILKATGLPKGSFYYHFEKKVDLAEAVLQYYSQIVLDLLQKIAEESDSWDQFCDAFPQAFQEKLGDRRYYGCPLAVVGMEIAFQEPDLARLYGKALEQVKDVLVQTLRATAGDLEHLEETAELCCAIYEGNLVLYRVSKDPNILLRLNAQLKQAIRHSGGKQKSAHFP